MSLTRHCPQGFADQRVDGRIRPDRARRAPRFGGLALRIAELDERRDRIGFRPARRERMARSRRRRAPRSIIEGALSFSSVTMRSASFGPTPCARPTAALSPQRHRAFAIRATTARTARSAPRARRRSARSAAGETIRALRRDDEAVKPDRLFADLGLDHQRHAARPRSAATASRTGNARDSPRRRHRGSRDPRRPNRTMPVSLPIMRSCRHDAARACRRDAHARWRRRARRPHRPLRPARWAAGAAPSPAPAPCSAWPRRRRDFLMWLGAYSAISSPACAAASSATARAWPSFSAALRIFVRRRPAPPRWRRGAIRAITAQSCVMQHHSRAPRSSCASLVTRHARHGRAACRRRRSRPSPCGQARDRSRECESRSAT